MKHALCVLTIIGLISIPSKAQKVTKTEITLTSEHYVEKRDGEWNEINPGLVLEMNNYFVVGMYYNSNKRISFLGGIRFSHSPIEHIELSTTGGAITGYKDYPIPMITVSIEFSYNGYGIKFTHLPRAIGLSFTIK